MEEMSITKRKSRQITLRQKKKLHNTYLLSLSILQTTPSIRSTHYLHMKHNQTIKHCNSRYGFTANPNLTLWTNCKDRLRNLPMTTYFNNINNLTFHNLCTHHKPPPGTRHLLGLGHKFIPQRAFPTPLPQSTFQEFKRNVRLRYTFAGLDSDPLTKNDKKIYIKSVWIPEPGNENLEQRLTNFQKQVLKTTKQNQTNITRPTYNLSRVQHQTLHSLKNDSKIVILLADKNLGPVIMERETYIKRVLSNHLLDKNTYEQLTDNMAKHKLNELQEQLTYIFENPSANVQNSLSNMEQKYSAKSLHHEHRIPTFYGLVKIHKQPWTLRPVVSCCGSLLATISTWIDFHLQKIRHKLPAFIKDSNEFQNELIKVQIP